MNVYGMGQRMTELANKLGADQSAPLIVNGLQRNALRLSVAIALVALVACDDKSKTDYGVDPKTSLTAAGKAQMEANKRNNPMTPEQREAFLKRKAEQNKSTREEYEKSLPQTPIEIRNRNAVQGQLWLDNHGGKKEPLGWGGWLLITATVGAIPGWLGFKYWRRRQRMAAIQKTMAGNVEAVETKNESDSYFN